MASPVAPSVAPSVASPMALSVASSVASPVALSVASSVASPVAPSVASPHFLDLDLAISHKPITRILDLASLQIFSFHPCLAK